MKTKEAILQMCGDYCAFHEASIYCAWIFGEQENADMCWEIEEIMEYAEDNFPDDFENDSLTKEQKAQIDVFARGWAESQDSGDYCDYEIQTVMIDGSNVYMKIN